MYNDPGELDVDLYVAGLPLPRTIMAIFLELIAMGCGRYACEEEESTPRQQPGADSGAT